jgi:hypothetical protein
MQEGDARQSKAFVRLAFFWAIVSALAGPPVEFLLALFGWLSVLVPCAWLGLWVVGGAFDLKWERDWGVVTVRAVDGSLLLAVLSQFLRERRVCTGHGSRRMFYRWFLVGPGLVVVGLLLPAAAALNVYPEPMALGWLGAAGLLAFRTFRRLAMLFAEGISVCWAAATGAAALLLAGVPLVQATIADAMLQLPQKTAMLERGLQERRYVKEVESEYKKGLISDKERERRLEWRAKSKTVGSRARASLDPDVRVMAAAMAFLGYAGEVLGGAVLAGAAAAAFMGVAAPTRDALPHFRLVLHLRQIARRAPATSASGGAAPSAGVPTPPAAAPNRSATAQ